MDLSIIIVNWNTRDLLAQCLESVYAYPPAGDFEVIVVDNASTDGSAAMVHERFPQVVLIENGENMGFALANNQAIGRSHGRHVLLLNPDTVVQSGALDVLVRFLDEHPDAGAAGSMLLNPDGTLQPSCHPAPTLGREMWRLAHLDRLHPVALYRMQEWPADRPRLVDTVQGASLIVRREVIEQVGPLDDSYFMYSEEVDWCERIREAGWNVYWVPGSRVVHLGGQSTRQVGTPMFLQLYRGKLQYFRKHHGAVYGLLYKGELFVAAAARILLTPLAWVLRPGQRREQTELAGRYGRLILALPSM
jgi:GT2 family glycosyltransferase